jgi:hypothetical protein
MNEPKKGTPAASPDAHTPAANPDALIEAGKDASIELSQEELDKVAAGTDTTLPTEQVTFNFGKIKWTYTQQK